MAWEENSCISLNMQLIAILSRIGVEMLVIPFYLWYVLEWLIRLPLKGRAYKNIAFEQEAYRHMDDFQYLSKRRHYAWLKYLLR